MAEISDLQARVLTLIQTKFPVRPHPYAAIGAECGCSEQEAFECVEALRQSGDIRRLGGIFSSAGLGYVSTLCAMSVTNPDDVESVAAVVNSYAEVTHNYLRPNRYNIWFTLIARSQARIDAIIDEIGSKTGYTDILDLPSTTMFKIQVDFKMTDDDDDDDDESVDTISPAPGASANPREAALNAEAMGAADQALVRIMQGNIGHTMTPFIDAAAQMTEQGYPMDAQAVCDRVNQWIDKGIVRQFGAVLRHRKMGFSFNAMTVWDIPEATTPQAGAIMARESRVSHCYERPRNPTWDANVYAMIHGKSKGECETCAADLHAQLAQAGIEVPVPQLLYSTKEFKKCSMSYFCEEER